MTTPTYCCEISLAVGEPLLGTAPHTEWWILLEYRAPFGHEALPDSDLDPSVKAHLTSWLDALPHSKVLFIRRPDRTSGPLMLYIHHATTRDIYAHELPDYDALLTLSLADVTVGTPINHPLYLTCVNGKRDVACAKFGMPVFQALDEAVGAAAWQSSHFGGHRFAATGVWLPYGIVYGRLDAATIPDVLAAHTTGHVTLDHYRGRSIFPPDAQVAEGALLQDDPTLAAWTLAERRMEGNTSVVTLQNGDTSRQFTLTEGPSDYEVAKSTGDSLGPVPVYRILGAGD